MGGEVAGARVADAEVFFFVFFLKAVELGARERRSVPKSLADG